MAAAVVCGYCSIMGTIDNRSARVPREFAALTRLFCCRLEQLQQLLYERHCSSTQQQQCSGFRMITGSSSNSSISSSSSDRSGSAWSLPWSSSSSSCLLWRGRNGSSSSRKSSSSGGSPPSGIKLSDTEGGMCSSSSSNSNSCCGDSNSMHAVNIFDSLASVLALGDVVGCLSSFAIDTPLYILLEDVAIKRLEGILFSKKEALWFLMWTAFASAPHFTPRRYTAALREKMLIAAAATNPVPQEEMLVAAAADGGRDSGGSAAVGAAAGGQYRRSSNSSSRRSLFEGAAAVQSSLTDITHTVQKLGAFHIQRLLLPLRLMGVHDPPTTRLCIDVSLDRDRGSFKRIDAALSLVYPLAFVNALDTRHALEVQSVWHINCSKIFLIGNAFRGEFGKMSMLAVLWAFVVKNLHVQTPMTAFLDRLLACVERPPSLFDWKTLRDSVSMYAAAGGGGAVAAAADVEPASAILDAAAGGEAGSVVSCSAIDTPESVLFSPDTDAGSSSSAWLTPVQTSSSGNAWRAAQEKRSSPSKWSSSNGAGSTNLSRVGWHSLEDLRMHDRLAVQQVKHPELLLQQLAAACFAALPLSTLRRCTKFPLLKAWAARAIDYSADRDPTVLAVTEQLQMLLLKHGIYTRAFVPVENAAAKPHTGKRSAFLRKEESAANAAGDAVFPLLPTATPQCVHVQLLHAVGQGSCGKGGGIHSAADPSASSKCGVLIFGETDGLRTLPSWETTFFNTGVNLMRLRLLRHQGWQVIALSVYEWREAESDAARLALVLDRLSNEVQVYVPFCEE